MLFVRDLHRDHLDAVLAGELEHVRQTVLAVPLKRIRARPRLVGTHSRTDLSVFLQGFHHRLDTLSRVNSAEPREDIQIVLAERHAVVGEVVRAAVAFVPSEDAINFGHTNDVIDTRKSADLLDRKRRGIADQVQFGQQLLGTLKIVNKDLDILEIFDVALDPLVFAAGRIDIRF